MNNEQAPTRAGRVRQSQKGGEAAKAFKASHALIVGIDAYRNGIRPLTTPVNDATRLAQLLADEHDYTVHLLVEDVRKERLAALFDTLSVGENDRLLFYFAGHGVALDGEDGPQGFLVPQDARAEDRETLLPMTELNAWLDALPCRHMLAILDCCFAGAFRWAATRRVETAALEVLHRERFERFIQSPAWQVLTSAAHNQTALDVVGGNAVGSRGIREEGGRPHSPFALALYDALKGEGDLIPKGDGDGVITATELYLYLRQTVEVGVAEAVNHDQTPGLWPLRKHDRGEFIFLTPGHALNLPPAPPLTDALNPWRGLKSYDQKHGNLFFGRDDEIAELRQRVEQQPLTAVLGASGTGKSSLVKAGLLPYLTQQETDWRILQPLRPGNTPIATLHKMLAQQLDEHASGRTITQMRHDTQTVANLVASWKASHPEQKLLLVIDQFEELVTLSSDKEREQFIQLLTKAVEQHRDCFRLIVTVRTDFEPQFDADMSLVPYWSAARYVVPPMDQADLRQVIEGPAALRVLYFEPAEMVDTLISEVLQTPGALPLLSFTLSEMYLHYLGRKADDRALTEEDYDALGGVIGSLRNRANAEYGTLPDDAHRETMRRVMLRMISVEGGELARRRVSRSELQYPTSAENVRVETVLNRLVTARLLVTGDDEGVPTIEPAHDALVLAWDKLLRWKQSAETYLPLQRRLAQAANEWQEAEQTEKTGLLWDDDPRLPQLEETLWSAHARRDGLRGRVQRAQQVLLPNTGTPSNTRWLNDVEVNFVQTSVRNRARFWRRLVGGISLFVIVLIGATIISLSLQQTAVSESNARATEVVNRTNAEGTAVAESTRAFQQQITAENEALVANARRLVADGRRVFEENPLAGLALVVEGLALVKDAPGDVQMSLLNNAIEVFQPGRVRFFGNNVERVEKLEEFPTLVIVRNLGGDILRTFDSDEPQILRGEYIYYVELTSDGNFIFIDYNNAGLLSESGIYEIAGERIWTVQSFELFEIYGYPYFNPNGNLFIVDNDTYKPLVWRSDTTDLLEWQLEDVPFDLSFSRDGSLMFLSYSNGSWGELRQTSDLEPVPGFEFVQDIRFEGSVLIAEEEIGKYEVLRIADLEPLDGLDGEIFTRPWLSSNGTFLIADNESGRSMIWRSEDIEMVSGLADHKVRTVEDSPDGNYFFVNYEGEGTSGELRGTSDLKPVEVLQSASLENVKFSSDGKFIFVDYDEEGVSGELRRLADLELVELPQEGVIENVEFSPDGRLAFVDYSWDSSEGCCFDDLLRMDNLQPVQNGVISFISFDQSNVHIEYADLRFEDQPTANLARPEGLELGDETRVINLVYSPDYEFYFIDYLSKEDEVRLTSDNKLLAVIGLNVNGIQWLASDHLLYWTEDGRAYVLDLAWLQAIGGMVGKSSISAWIDIVCQYPLKMYVPDNNELEEFFPDRDPSTSLLIACE